MDSPSQYHEIQEACTAFLPEYRFKSYDPIETGHINNTYRVVLSADDEVKEYLLQNLNTNVFHLPQLVTENIVRCATFLHEKCPDYPYQILMPVMARDKNKFLLQRKNKAWRMFNFIPDAIALDQVSSSHQAMQIGEAFGVFLAYINQDDPIHYKVTIPDFHNFTKRYIDYKKFLDDLGDIKDEKVSYLIAAIDRYADQFLKLEEMDFPIRIIHHDTKANNVLLDEKTGKTKCIIDLDTLMPGNIFSDFGDLMRTVFNPYKEDGFPENGNLVDQKIITSLIDGFLLPMEQELTNDEKEYLIKGGKKITLLQVLRFLDDHLKGDKYYQVEYTGHNLERALSQMYLYESMENSGIALP